MSNQQTNAKAQSQPGAEERERPHQGGAGPEMKQAMAQMMTHCACGPEMMAKMAGLVGGCGPSKPAEPTQEKPQMTTRPVNDDVPTFEVEVEETKGLCPAGERYAEQQLHTGRIPVLSCEGPCIRGEIARQAAHLIGKQPSFARACQGEAVAVPHSAMARWAREAPQVLVLDGCFLHCQARLMRRMIAPGRLVEVDALLYYHKYVDLFEIDSVPEAERKAVAQRVAHRVLAKFSESDPAVSEGLTLPSGQAPDSDGDPRAACRPENGQET